MRDQEQKSDQGKLMLELVPASAVMSLGKVLTFGANKYKPEGWRDVDPGRYIGALLRHLYAHLGGEIYDEDSGFMHIEHVLCNAAFLNEFMHNERDYFATGVVPKERINYILDKGEDMNTEMSDGEVLDLIYKEVNRK